MLTPARHSGFIPHGINQPPPLSSQSAADASAQPVFWASAISVDLLTGPGQYRSPVSAGRPDVLLYDAEREQLRNRTWSGWVDMADYFRLAGIRLPVCRHLMVLRNSPVERDIEQGLKWQATKTQKGHSLARSFYSGHSRGELDGVCSLIRLGLTEPNATRNLAHYMAIKASRPPASEGVSLIERLNLLKSLFEQPQQAPDGRQVWTLPAPYPAGGYLTHQNEFGQSPLELAMLTRNTAMEEALRIVTGQPRVAIEPIDLLAGTDAPAWEPQVDFSLEDLLDLAPPNLECTAHLLETTAPTIDPGPADQAPTPEPTAKLITATEARRSDRLLKKRQRSTDTAFTEYDSGLSASAPDLTAKVREMKNGLVETTTGRPM